MTAHYDIEQGSSEWFEIKHGKIGGTRAKLLYTKTDTLLIELLAETIEPFDEDADESYKSDAMENGSYLEPQARLELEAYCGVHFKEVGWIQSEDELIGISPDGISHCETMQCEIKCPQAKAHIRMCLSNEIPLEYIPQCIHSFVANDKLEKLYFCSYRPENLLKPLFVKELTRDSVVDLGWKKKIEVEVIGAKGVPIKPKIETVTDFKTISDWVKVASNEVKELKTEISKSINQIKF